MFAVPVPGRGSWRFRRAALVALGCVLAIAGMSRAQEPLSDELQAEVSILQGRVDLFFRQLADKSLDPERPVREIVGSGPLKDRNDEINRLIDQIPLLDQRYGVYTGHEAIGVKALGSDLVLLRYLYKAERFPVIWHFAFYRSTVAGLKRDWTLVLLRFDTKLEQLEP